MVRLGLPKGRLGSQSRRICSALGVDSRPGVQRYACSIDGTRVSIHLLKAPDVAGLLRMNLLDLGLTGDEWLAEAGLPPDLRCFGTGGYEASVSLLMAEEDRRPAVSVASVVTPFPNLTRELLAGIAPDADIIPVSGSSEALVPEVADACMDLVETGMTAAVNGLAVRMMFRRVTTHMVRSPGSDPTAVASVVERLAQEAELARWS